MKLRKFITSLLLVMTMFFIYSCGNKGNSHKNPEVVAKIDRELVKKEEVDEYYKGLESTFIAQYGENYKDSSDFRQVYLDLINQYIEQRVLVQLAKDENVIDESSIQEKVNEEFESMKSVFGTEEAFVTAIVNSRFKDEEDYKSKLKISLIIEELLSKETNNLKISNSEIKDYYENNPDKFKKGPGADVYHIFLDNEDSAKDVLNLLEEGEDFAELARTYGQDGSASVGGYLGYQEFDNSQLVDEFMKEVKDMYENEIRGPVKTQFGYHIIKVENLNTKDWVQELERVSDSIEETLKSEKINQVMETLVNKAKDKYKVKIYEDNILLKKE